MERLTYRLKSGATNLVGIIEANGPVEKAILRQIGWERLAAYEDTGLTPEEVEALPSLWMEKVAELNALGSIDHLRELVQAEKDGRPVLPCKPGCPVYAIVQYPASGCELLGIVQTKFKKIVEFVATSFICENGRWLLMGAHGEGEFDWDDCYLTRAAAEAALEAQKGGNV